MSHKTTRKGGRSWWGKRETKEASKVTRRRDDREAVAPYPRGSRIMEPHVHEWVDHLHTCSCEKRGFDAALRALREG